MNNDNTATPAQPVPTWIGRRRQAEQETNLELLSRIDDLKTELRGERERADRLDNDLALAQAALRLVRREETLRLRDRAGLAAFSFLAVAGFWGQRRPDAATMNANITVCDHALCDVEPEPERVLCDWCERQRKVQAVPCRSGHLNVIFLCSACHAKWQFRQRTSKP